MESFMEGDADDADDDGADADDADYGDGDAGDIYMQRHAAVFDENANFFYIIII